MKRLPDPELAELVAFGTRFRHRRLLARLSVAALAKQSRLSESTVKSIEHARTRPAVLTLVALMSVDRLGLCLSDLPAAFRESVRAAFAPPPPAGRRCAACRKLYLPCLADGGFCFQSNQPTTSCQTEKHNEHEANS